MGPVNPQVEGHQRLVRSALGGDIPASHKGHHFGRRTHQAGAVEPDCRRVKLLTLEAVKRVVITLRGAARPAVALLWGGLFPGYRELKLTTRAAGVHTALDLPQGLQTLAQVLAR